MDVLIVLLVGSFIVGMIWQTSDANQSRLALLAAIAATALYYVSRRAM